MQSKLRGPSLALALRSDWFLPITMFLPIPVPTANVWKETSRPSLCREVVSCSRCHNRSSALALLQRYADAQLGLSVRAAAERQYAHHVQYNHRYP